MPQLEFVAPRILAEILNETATTSPLRWHEYEARTSSMFGSPTMAPASPPEAQAPVAAPPTPAMPSGVTDVGDIREAAMKPGGTELAERLID